MHRALLLMMFVIPITGYLISTSAGKPVPVFDLLEIPALVGKNTRLRDAAIAVHYYLGYGVGVMAVAHAAAAIKHQFVDRDGTLARMIWG